MSEGIEQAPGGCGCVACTAIFTVNGCGPTPLPGATVSVAGGGTGTTDSSGRVTLAVPGPGTVSVTVSKARFTSHTGNQTVGACGGFAGVVNLVPATGYHCSTLCVDPLPNTLNVTIARLGSCTVTWTGAHWDGTLVYSYPACGVTCGASTVTIAVRFSSFLLLSWNTLAFLPGCPNDTGGGTSSANDAMTSTVCPTSFHYSGAFNLVPASASGLQCLFCEFGTNTFATTVTE